MTKTCKSCDGNGSLFIRGVMAIPREKCDVCDGECEVVVTCEWCETPLDHGEVDICDRCAEESEASCEHCPATGGGCIVCRPTIAIPEGESIFVDAKL